MTSARSHKSTREVRQLGDSLLTLGDVQTSWQARRMETQVPAWGNLAWWRFCEPDSDFAEAPHLGLCFLGGIAQKDSRVWFTAGKKVWSDCAQLLLVGFPVEKSELEFYSISTQNFIRFYSFLLIFTRFCLILLVFTRFYSFLLVFARGRVWTRNSWFWASRGWPGTNWRHSGLLQHPPEAARPLLANVICCPRTTGVTGGARRGESVSPWTPTGPCAMEPPDAHLICSLKNCNCIVPQPSFDPQPQATSWGCFWGLNLASILAFLGIALKSLSDFKKTCSVPPTEV